MKPQTEDRVFSLAIAGLLLSALLVSPADAYHDGRSPQQYEHDRQQQMARDGLQLRQQRQMYQERQYDYRQNLQDDLYYQQQRENMRNQGYGRPGLDGGQ